MAKDESEDPWVTYAWQYGDVSQSPHGQDVQNPKTDADILQDEEAVHRALGKLIVPADRRDRLSCKTRPLDYLDNPRNIEDLQKK